MASVSYGLNRGASSQPDDITTGTLAVSTNDLEVRVDNTKGWTRAELKEYLNRIADFIIDGRDALLANL